MRRELRLSADFASMACLRGVVLPLARCWRNRVLLGATLVRGRGARGPGGARSDSVRSGLAVRGPCPSCGTQMGSRHRVQGCIPSGGVCKIKYLVIVLLSLIGWVNTVLGPRLGAPLLLWLRGGVTKNSEVVGGRPG